MGVNSVIQWQMYGIPNCSTVKKARLWLEDEGVAYQFHDFKKEGVDRILLQYWVGELGTDWLLNKRGTTWRKLSLEQQAGASTLEGALALMMEFPSLIKRPVLTDGREVVLGFDAGVYQGRFRSG